MIHRDTSGFSATGGSDIEVQRVSPLASLGNGGTVFASVAVRVFPREALPLNVAHAAVNLAGLRLTLVEEGSLKRWYAWSASGGESGGPVWRPVGKPVITPFQFGAANDLCEWTQLSVRRDPLRDQADLWIGSSLVAIQIPLSSSAGNGFTCRADLQGLTLVDHLVFSTTSLIAPDGDRDGMPDAWELAHPGLDPASDDRDADLDGDGVTNIQEYFYGSDPDTEDSDGDGMEDDWEIAYGLNPADARDQFGDNDGDGLLNGEERFWGTDPTSSDSTGPLVVYVRADNDGVEDGSFAHPWSDFMTAFNSVQEGGTLVILGEGGPVDLYGQSTLYTGSKSMTIRGVNNAVITAVDYDYWISSPESPLTFFTSGGSIEIDNIYFMECQSEVGGGALNLSGGSFTVTRCTFDLCFGEGGGGAILAGTCAGLVIDDCRFNANASTGYGGAILAYNCPSLAVTGCVFNANWVDFYGGDVCLYNCSGAAVERCRFVGGASGQDGGAVSLQSSSATFTSCLLAQSYAYYGNGGAIYAASGSSAALRYCTVVDNFAGAGAGVKAMDSSSVYGTACIFWGNWGLSPATLSHIASPTPVNFTYTSSEGAALPGTGNNSSNPQFIRTSHPELSASLGAGYGLSYLSSAMIDTGDPAFVPFDADGQVRKRRLHAGHPWFTSNADRGAFDYSDSDSDSMPDAWEKLYGLDPLNAADRDLDADQDGYSNSEEYNAKTNPLSASSHTGTVIYVSPGGNDAFVGQWQRPVRTIARALALIPASGARIALRDGVYSGPGNTNLVSSTKSYQLRGINGASRVTVDCGGTSRFLSLNSQYVTIRGITVRNGLAATGNGGAIVTQSGWNMALTLLNCRFVNCQAPAGQGGALAISSGFSCYSCEFLGNSALDGGAMAFLQPTSWTSGSSNTFAWNQANRGGAVFAQQAPMLEMYTGSFHRNTAREGGAMFLLNCSGGNPDSPTTEYSEENPVFQDLTFTENTAWGGTPGDQAGGALALVNSGVWFSGLVFERNLSSGAGGAIWNGGGATAFHRTRLIENEAVVNGGAMSITAGLPKLVNCAFVHGRAGTAGGAIHRSGTAGELSLAQCTLTRNRTDGYANSGSALWSGGPLRLTNSLVWYNGSSGVDSPANAVQAPGKTIVFRGCNLSGSVSGSGSSENHHVAPALAFDQYHLTGAGATLGLGSSSAVSQCMEMWNLRDIDGESRLLIGGLGVNVEAGCDEFIDTDADGVPDWFERLIIDMSDEDAITSLADLDADSAPWGSGTTLQTYLALGLNPSTFDSDGDGISDIRERELALLTGGSMLTGNPGKYDPLLADTDGNGTVDIDPEDLSDPEKDSDRDGVVNSIDAFPDQRYLSCARTPESRYALIDLGTGMATDINNSGQVAIGDITDGVTHLYRWPAASPGALRDEIGDSREWPNYPNATGYEAGFVESGGIDEQGRIYWIRSMQSTEPMPLHQPRPEMTLARSNASGGPGFTEYPLPNPLLLHPTRGFYTPQAIDTVHRVDRYGNVFAARSSSALYDLALDVNASHSAEQGTDWQSGLLFGPGMGVRRGSWSAEVHYGNYYDLDGGITFKWYGMFPFYGGNTEDFITPRSAPAGVAGASWHACTRGGRAIIAIQTEVTDGNPLPTWINRYTWYQFDGTGQIEEALPLHIPAPRGQNDLNPESPDADGYHQGGWLVTSHLNASTLYVHTKPGEWAAVDGDDIGLELPDTADLIGRTSPFPQWEFTMDNGGAPSAANFVRPSIYSLARQLNRSVLMNNKGEILLCSPPGPQPGGSSVSIWRNGHATPVKDLTGVPAGFDMSRFYATDLNDSGVIVGSCWTEGNPDTGVNDGWRAVALVPYQVIPHKVLADGAIDTEAGVLFPSMNSPEVGVDSVSVHNVRFDSDGQVVGDIAVSGTIASAVCDAISGPNGEISTARLFINNEDEPQAEIPLTVTKSSGGPLGRRYPYAGSFNQTLYDVPLSLGRNVVSINAADKITGIDGFSQWTLDVGLPDVQNSAGILLATSTSLSVSVPPGADLSTVANVGVQFTAGSLQLPPSIFQRAAGGAPDELRFTADVAGVSYFLTLLGVEDTPGRRQLTAALRPNSVDGPGYFVTLGESQAGNGHYTGGYQTFLPLWDDGAGAGPQPVPVTLGAPLLNVESEPSTLNTWVYEIKVPPGFKNQWKDREISIETEELGLTQTTRIRQQFYLKEQDDGMLVFGIRRDEIVIPTTFLYMPTDLEKSYEPGEVVELAPVPPQPPLSEEEIALRKDLEGVGFAGGFVRGFVGGGGKMIEETGKAVVGVGKFIGNGLLVFGGEVTVIFKYFTGQDYEEDLQLIAEINAPAEETFRTAGEIAKVLGKVVKYLGDNLQTLEDMAWSLATGEDMDAEAEARAIRNDDLNRKIFEFGSEAISSTYKEFENAPPGVQGYKTGRVVFEIASILLPLSKAGNLMKLKRSEFLTKLLNTDVLGPLARIRVLAARGSALISRACFAQGTLVKTDSGEWPIEEIQRGDMVWAGDPYSSRKELRRVSEVYVTHPSEIYTVSYSYKGRSGRPVTERLRVTGNHPFWTSSHGMPGFVFADRLKPGDQLRLLWSKEATVTGITVEQSMPGASFTTYNFEVEGLHTYYVGNAGVWVHNISTRFCDEVTLMMDLIAERNGIQTVTGNRFRIFKLLAEDMLTRKPKKMRFAAKEGNYLSHVVGREAVDDYAARHALPVDWNAPNAEELMAERAKEILNYKEQDRIRANFEGPSKAVNFEIHHLAESRTSGNLGISEDAWDLAPSITLPEKLGPRGGFSNAEASDFLGKLNEGGHTATMIYHKGPNGLVPAIDDVYRQMGIPNNSRNVLGLADKNVMLQRLCHLYTHDPRFKELNAWPATRDYYLWRKKVEGLDYTVPNAVPFLPTWIAP